MSVVSDVEEGRLAVVFGLVHEFGGPAILDSSMEVSTLSVEDVLVGVLGLLGSLLCLLATVLLRTARCI